MGVRTKRLPVVIAVIATVAVLTAALLSGSGSAFSDALGSPSGAPSPTPVKKANAPPDRYAVVLIADGARYDQWDLSHMPNLAALVKRGTTFTQATVGQLPSITETSHATLGTGVYPYRHTILGDSWRVPGQDKMTPNLLDSTLDRTGYIEDLIRQQNVPTIAGILHRKFPQGKVIALSGHKVYAATAMGTSANYVSFGIKDAQGRFAPASTPKQAPDPSILRSNALALKTYPRAAGVEDHWATNLAQQLAKRYRPRLLMINYPEMDNAGHSYGTDPKYLSPIMQALDKDIGQLEDAYRAMGILSKTDFFITSDHGMVPATNIINLTQIQNVIKAAGATTLSIGHGDYCPIWLDDPTKAPTVAQALANAAIPHVRAVYVKNAAGKYTLVSSPSAMAADTGLSQAYSDLLATYGNASSADIVLLYDENTITMTPTLQKAGRKGDHEGATWGAQHIGLFIAGPGIKQHYVSGYPARLVDIPTTIAALFTAHPRNVDGVPLTDAMTSPHRWMTAASNAVKLQRAADTAALSAQQSLSPSNPPSSPSR